MASLTPLEIYKALPKTNCRECGIPSCMAFAAAVIKEEKGLKDCPYLDKARIDDFEKKLDARESFEKSQEETLRDLKEKMSALDFASRADIVGGVSDGESISIKCLGKDFTIDARGNIASECHTHAWFAIPLLSYIINGGGKNPAGKWVPLRELDGGAAWYGLFGQRCEKPLKSIADTHVELFEDLIGMFSGAYTANDMKADISVVLYPFPKVPILICYWKPEDGMESQLHIFYDSTASENLGIESAYLMGAGIASMVEKIMQNHR